MDDLNFSRDDVINGHVADDSKRDRPGHIWIEDAEGPVCLRLYAGYSDAPASVPIIFLEGDVITSGNAFKGNVVVGDWYEQLSPSLKQAEAERFGAAIGRPFLNLARPGVYGASGLHTHRRRPRESRLVDQALDIIKQQFGWSRFDIAGFSGGGHIVAALMARRADIRCAVIASGNVAVRHRLRDMTMTGLEDMTGFTDFLDPIDLVPEVAQHPPQRVILLTDPQDRVVSAASQTAYLNALRAVGIAAEQRMVTALDPKHHVLRLETILAVAAAGQ